MPEDLQKLFGLNVRRWREQRGWTQEELAAASFDVGYRPDGIQVAFDSKTLNDEESVGKNWQNMINDLATEATTVHMFSTCRCRVYGDYSSALPVRFYINAMIGTLERLGRRAGIDGPDHMAEAISLVLWNPANGQIDSSTPAATSPLCIEKFADQIEAAYVSRYKGLPPHAS